MNEKEIHAQLGDFLKTLNIEFKDKVKILKLYVSGCKEAYGGGYSDGWEAQLAEKDYPKDDGSGSKLYPD